MPTNLNEANETSFEELTSQGEASGLEAERGDDFEISAPFDPAKIDVITQQRTVDLLLKRLEEGEIDLSPDFQRRGNLWNATRKSSLIESLLLRIPIPSIYVSEDLQGDYAVVDGLQRLCAIAHFVDANSLNQAVKTKLPPLRLQNLQSLTEFEDCTFDELPRILQRRIRETEMTLHVIRAGTPIEVKFNIFSRINQGGLPLNAQEIRNAIFPGEWRRKISKLSKLPIFLEATENKIKGERMEDLELILRFIAHVNLGRTTKRHSDQNLDEFLNSTVKNTLTRWTEKDWEMIEKAFTKTMKYAKKIFGEAVFRKYSEPDQPRKPINRGLFESESVALAFYDTSELEYLCRKSFEVQQGMRDAYLNNSEFYNSLLYATGKGGASNTRLHTILDILDTALDD